MFMNDVSSFHLTLRAPRGDREAGAAQLPRRRGLLAAPSRVWLQPQASRQTLLGSQVELVLEMGSFLLPLHGGISAYDSSSGVGQPQL